MIKKYYEHSDMSGFTPHRTDNRSPQQMVDAQQLGQWGEDLYLSLILSDSKCDGVESIRHLFCKGDFNVWYNGIKYCVDVKSTKLINQPITLFRVSAGQLIALVTFEPVFGLNPTQCLYKGQFRGYYRVPSDYDKDDIKLSWEQVEALQCVIK